MSSLCTDLTAGCGNCSPGQLTSIQGLFTQAQTIFLCTNLLTNTVNTTYFQSAVDKVGGSITGVTEGLNCIYLVMCTALVFIMHAGFAMVRSATNSQFIILQSIITWRVFITHVYSSALERFAARTRWTSYSKLFLMLLCQPSLSTSAGKNFSISGCAGCAVWKPEVGLLCPPERDSFLLLMTTCFYLHADMALHMEDFGTQTLTLITTKSSQTRLSARLFSPCPITLQRTRTTSLMLMEYTACIGRTLSSNGPSLPPPLPSLPEP